MAKEESETDVEEEEETSEDDCDSEDEDTTEESSGGFDSIFPHIEINPEYLDWSDWR